MEKRNFGEKLKAKSSITSYFVSSSAPDALLFEPFLPWIWKIMLAYQEQEEPETENYAPEGIRYSKAYYSKKFR